MVAKVGSWSVASSDVRPSRGSQERPGQRQGLAAVQDSDGESDDGWLRRAPGSDEIMECNRVEFNVTESLQFRKEFEAGREQAHEDTAYAEGYGYGAEEAAANWEIENQMAEPYSSESEADGVLSEREAESSVADEWRDGRWRGP